uniref:SRCR domain-containing protein n=1 Tax=Lates calcarifer TaxID=8187 RepID=A0A4W6EBP5_LATCA
EWRSSTLASGGQCVMTTGILVMLSLRLVNSDSNCSGRVEIFHSGQWGTVCDDSWGLNDAQVVCQQLGCGRAVSATQSAHFGEGSGPIWLDNVQCLGNESSITDCVHQGLGSHNCGHHEDAGVICEGTNSLRLVNSDSNCSGRVEIFHSGQWGTVCDDSWGLNDAQVVCQQLGCGRAVSATQSAHFGEGSGPIWLDNVQCLGNESSIIDCANNSVSPTSPGQNPLSSAVRLVNSDSNCSGTVEIFHSGQWGTVCDDRWDFSDAQVVCQQLGCGRAVSAKLSAHFGEGSGPIWLDDVQCLGNESSITDCVHQGLGSHNCGHHEDAGVICEATPTIKALPQTKFKGCANNSVSPTSPGQNPLSSAVRLVNSDSNCSGRVEIFHSGQWGTVCDDSWGLSDAQVVCQQLGCGRAVSATQSAHFGEGSGPIWLDNVQCLGNESSITDCVHQGLGSHNCGHHEDAGVICEGKLRLVNSDSNCSGRVEIFHSGQWGTVCDDRWGLNDAQVVCQQLGCGRAVSATQSAHFGEGSGPIWLDNVQCLGNESSITDCANNSVSPTSPGQNPLSSAVRLVNSDSNCSGRVEIFHSGQWGTVCDDRWGLSDAQVVCQQLDCGRAVSATQSAHFGEGSGPIWLDDVQCLGNESSITDCVHQGLGSHNCGHHEDAGVICEVRLVNSDSNCSGRVEIFQYGHWGTVCDDSWGLSDAQVVCQQLGCGRAVSAKLSAHFGEGSGPIWLDDVQCLGNESSITDCVHQGLGSHNCGHNEDAGVICEGKCIILF